MTGPDFDHFCQLVRERSGLVLGPDKAYLVKARLDAVVRAHGFPDLALLLSTLRRAPTEPLIEACVNALATHESSFFRDGSPFVALAASVLPELIAARQAARTLRIWCAACSSGQEAYSVAIVLKEMAGRLAGWNIEILGTDFSRPILQKAATALYSDFEVRRGLSPERLERWFDKSPEGWRPKPPIRQMVTFRPHNLMQRLPAASAFDIIFCRNVLIYFDVDQKLKVLDLLARSMAQDGALFLGSAESILGLPASLAASPSCRGLFHRAAEPSARSA